MHTTIQGKTEWFGEKMYVYVCVCVCEPTVK